MNLASADEATPLAVAVKEGHTAVVALLLACPRIDVNLCVNGAPPLTIAAHRGHADIVDLLLRHKRIDPSVPTLAGETALAVAAGCGHVDVVRYLFSVTEDPNHGGMGGAPPLVIAAGKGHASVVKALLSYYKVDPNAQTDEGATALAIAAQEAGSNVGCLEVVRALLSERRLNPNAGALAPLLVAAQAGSAEVVALLLADDRVNVAATNRSGRGALQLACLEGHALVVSMLLQVRFIHTRLTSDQNTRTPEHLCEKGLTPA